jgi:outer membrane protein OmpA-like peptidoglycan-associated protein
MRQLLSIALLASLTVFTANHAFGQNSEFQNAITAKVNFLDYGLFYNQELHFSQGFEVGYFRNVHKYVNVGVPVKVGIAKLPTEFSKNNVTFSGDVIAQALNTNTTSRFLPYAFAGVGITNDELAKTLVQVPIGGGIQYKIGKYASVAVQGEFRKAFSDNRDNAQVGLGFFYLLHKPDPSKLDQDGDGTPDMLDKCPTAAGPATALGCPDTDKDGVANSEDECPDRPGPLETKGCPDADNDGVTDENDKCPDIPGTIDGCPDTDNDGVSDDKDECPTVPGRWNGCPDTDLDGIPDKDDKCPTEAGTAEMNGCPEKLVALDTDGDGVPDDEDQCPELVGKLNGCPDSDEDGIADKDDKCPTEAGKTELDGCPERAPADSDKDGIVDADDACPFIAGTAKGCPDTDGDSVADKDDRCPNEKGEANNNGCPIVKDADKDGIDDDKDPCPYQAGSANGCPDADGDNVADKDDPCPNNPGTLKGCPDSDGDGIADKDDRCPLAAGKLNGCPDTDNDGVADQDDKCPNTAGVAENGGCPKVVDTDKDGVADADDLCPNEAGKASTKGCPDRDNDGTADKDDQCPDKPGPFEGCPDSDKDGVADHKDKCPTVPATTADGCPPPPPVPTPTPTPTPVGDSDKDGVADNIDRCPNTPGSASNNGCPEVRKETKERLAFATQAVQFETGKANLKAQSFSILDEIVDIMRQYPDYNLSIAGHTDDVGDDDGNLALSRERAKTCYDYLVFRGIKAERLRHAGFGEVRPIADNNSVTGREMNRRVEFELTLY